MLNYYADYAPADPGNPFVVPPPIFNSKNVDKSTTKRAHLSSKPIKKKKGRFLKLPPLLRNNFPTWRQTQQTSTFNDSVFSTNSIKMCLLGASGVGKSPFVTQFCNNSFPDEFDPTIEDSYRKCILFDNRQLLLEILDTCGLEEYTDLRNQWIAESEGFLVMFSCVTHVSVDLIGPLLQQISRVKGVDITEIPVVLVATKYDLDQSYDFDMNQLHRIAKESGAPLIFTSARYVLNVNETFNELTRLVLQTRQNKTKFSNDSQ